MTKIFNIQIDRYESLWSLRLRVKSPRSLRVHSLTLTSSQTKLTYLIQYMTNSYTQFSIYELKITHFRLQYMQNSCTKFSTIYNYTLSSAKYVNMANSYTHFSISLKLHTYHLKYICQIVVHNSLRLYDYMYTVSSTMYDQ